MKRLVITHTQNRIASEEEKEGPVKLALFMDHYVKCKKQDDCHFAKKSISVIG
jgi:hypothetical protein